MPVKTTDFQTVIRRAEDKRLELKQKSPHGRHPSDFDKLQVDAGTWNTNAEFLCESYGPRDSYTGSCHKFITSQRKYS